MENNEYSIRTSLFLRHTNPLLIESMKLILFTTIIVSFFFCSSCNGDKEQTSEIETIKLSQNKKGIGPITDLDLPTISDSLMKLGQELFNKQCSQCHTMEYKNTGPDISDILAIRKPEWVMNFLLNKEEMLQRDSLATITLNKYDEICGADIKSEQEALKILEYLRIYQIWLHEFNAL